MGTMMISSNVTVTLADNTDAEYEDVSAEILPSGVLMLRSDTGQMFAAYTPQAWRELMVEL